MRFPTYPRLIQREVRYSVDPVRYATLALAVQRLRIEGVEGDFAELGVWRGNTARFLRLCAPERRLHLFDTFAGFPDEIAQDNRFRDTSLELVKRRIGGTQNVDFHVGPFPGTTAGLKDKRFALVMLDADCYPSTIAGLQFFYPRLTEGGYLFFHDFNSPESDQGVSRAVAAFMSDKPERMLEIPDTWGSAFFRKLSYYRT